MPKKRFKKFHINARYWSEFLNVSGKNIDVFFKNSNLVTEEVTFLRINPKPDQTKCIATPKKRKFSKVYKNGFL